MTPSPDLLAVLREAREALADAVVRCTHGEVSWSPADYREFARKMESARAACDAALSAPEPQGWRPIAEAPKDETPVDLWRDGERLTNMYRVQLSPTNVFYEPVEEGPCVVRDATHFMPLLPPPEPQK